VEVSVLFPLFYMILAEMVAMFALEVNTINQPH